MRTLFELPKPIEKQIICLTCKHSYKRKEFDFLTEKYRKYWVCLEFDHSIGYSYSKCSRYIYDPEFNFNKNSFYVTK